MTCPSLLSMLDASFEPASLADINGNILHANASAQGLLLELQVEEAVDDNNREIPSNMSTFLSFPTQHGCHNSLLSWKEIIEGLVAGCVYNCQGAKCLKRDGTTFSVDVNLVKLECSTLSGCRAQSNEEQEGAYVCMYMRNHGAHKRMSELEEKGISPLARHVDTSDSDDTIEDEGMLQSGDKNVSLPKFGHNNERDFLGRNTACDSVDNDQAKKRDSYQRCCSWTGLTVPIDLDDAVKTRHAATAEKSPCVRRICKEANGISERCKCISCDALDASLDARFNITESGTILLANKAAVEQFGWSYDEFIGRNIGMICSGDPAQNQNSFLEYSLDSCEKNIKGKKQELKARRKDGTEFLIELGLAEMPTDPGMERLFCCFTNNLTTQKEDAMELKRRLRLMSSVFDASFDSMFTINQHGIIQEVNEAAAKLFGWTRQEFIGQNISIICGGGHASKHNNYMKNYLKTGEKHVMGKRRELNARRKDGTEFPIELGLAEAKTELGGEQLFCGFVKDLTFQKKYEEEQKRKFNLTMGVVDVSFDSMFAIDELGTILMVNDKSSKQFGWTKEEFLGQNIKMIMCAEHAARHDGYIKQYLKTGIKKVMGKERILPARRKDGSTFPIWLGLTEVFSVDDKSQRVFVGFVRDLTDQKRLYEMEIMNATSQALLQNMLPEEYYQALNQ